MSITHVTLIAKQVANAGFNTFGLTESDASVDGGFRVSENVDVCIGANYMNVTRVEGTGEQTAFNTSESRDLTDIDGLLADIRQALAGA